MGIDRNERRASAVVRSKTGAFSIRLRIDPDPEQVAAKLRAMGLQFEYSDYRPVFAEIGNAFAAQEVQAWRTKGRIFGAYWKGKVPWANLSERYARKKNRAMRVLKGGEITRAKRATRRKSTLPATLLKTGRLYSEVTSGRPLAVDGMTGWFGASSKYSRGVMFGNKGQKNPARPFVGVSPGLRKAANAAFQRFTDNLVAQATRK